MGFPTIGQPESEEIQEMKKSQLKEEWLSILATKSSFLMATQTVNDK